MPAFFVHGVPDTSALWDSVRANIERDDVIAPNLPGFGAPVPDGFGATKEEYVDWVIAEIEKVGEPVDIVGHDWGSISSSASCRCGPSSSARGQQARARSTASTCGTTSRRCGRRPRSVSRSWRR